jgi:hypothetical protein
MGTEGTVRLIKILLWLAPFVDRKTARALRARARKRAAESLGYGH